MNPRLLLIRLLLKPEVWAEYRQFIHIKDDRHLETMYRLLDELIEKHNREITAEEYKAAVELVIDSERDKDKEVYHHYLSILFSSEVGDTLIHDLLVKVRQRDIAEKLATQCYEFIEGHKSLEDIKKTFERFANIEDTLKEAEFVTDDLEQIYEQTVATPGLRWRLQVLNKMLGSLRQGDFGFIFARPETGKTTFLASEVTHFAKQTDSPILWFNNEEQGIKVMTRCYQAALGVTLEELMRDRQVSKHRYFEETKGNIRIFDDASIHKRQIEDLCSRLKPGLVVIDQIDKLKGFDGDREDLKLGSIYQWARELAKSYCPVIAVCQADGSGDGQKWLTMSNVANAKTSKQAEADFIIGIGKTYDEALEYTRHINISKNKLQGDPDTNPELRHGRTDVRIEPQIARYVDIGAW